MFLIHSFEISQMFILIKYKIQELKYETGKSETLIFSYTIKKVDTQPKLGFYTLNTVVSIIPASTARR